MTNTFDIEEFNQIFHNNHDYLMRVAYKYVDDSNKASDIVQEVFIKLNRQDPAKFKETGHLRGWLNTVCRNTACNYLRNNRKYIQLDEEKEKDRISNDLDPSTQVETEETLTDNKEIILKCLEKLGKKQKKCLVLRYFHNKSYNDISEEMGISDSSVGYNINAGISNLKKLVENHHKSERNKSRISSEKS
jgi:RNA polymerase sigma-70 factor (ECF subfamily)